MMIMRNEESAKHGTHYNEFFMAFFINTRNPALFKQIGQSLKGSWKSVTRLG